jgi:hypothetical protein
MQPIAREDSMIAASQCTNRDHRGRVPLTPVPTRRNCDTGPVGPVEFVPLGDGTLAIVPPWFEDEHLGNTND